MDLDHQPLDEQGACGKGDYQDEDRSEPRQGFIVKEGSGIDAGNHNSERANDVHGNRHDDEHDDGNDDDLVMNIDDAVEELGMGRFQYQILIAAGLCFAADSMEVLLLTFLSTVLQVEWGLTDDQTDAMVSVVFVGAMSGTLVLGRLGDQLGRRPIFMATSAIIAMFGLGTAFATSYAALLFARFMVGFGVGGLTVPFDTLAELVPSSHRGRNLLYIEFFWTGGTLLVPLVAHATLGEGSGGSWRSFVTICAIPCVIATLLGIVLVPESPRWLLTQGRHDAALRILREAAARNGKDAFIIFPDGIRLEMGDDHEEVTSVADLFSPQWASTTALLWIAWFGLAFLYYGAIILLSLVFSAEEESSVDDVQTETYEFDYVAIFISGSSEIPGLFLVLLTVDRFGRIPLQVLNFTAGGIATFAVGTLSYFSAPRALLIFLGFLSRMFMMAASCMTWVFTPELLPTEIRSTGHSAANAIGRMGAVIAPFIISKETPTLVISTIMLAISIVSSVAISRLPETAGRQLGNAGTGGMLKAERVPTTELT